MSFVILSTRSAFIKRGILSSFVSGDAPLDAPSTNTKGNVDPSVSTQKKHQILRRDPLGIRDPALLVLVGRAETQDDVDREPDQLIPVEPDEGYPTSRNAIENGM